MMEIIIQSLVVGWLGFIFIGGVYCWIIIPIYVRFKWKKVLLSINTLPTKEQNIIKYIQLFSEYDITKCRYILERDSTYRAYDSICDILFSDNISKFKFILEKLDKIKDSDTRTDIMSAFEHLSKKDNLCYLYQLEEYLNRQLKNILQFEADSIKEKKLSERNSVLNKLKEHLFNTHNSKLYFIILSYVENNLIEISDVKKLIDVFTEKTTENEIRSYINTIILSKGDKSDVKSKN